MSSNLDHWHITATVFKDRVEEVHFISDPVRNVRRRRHTKIWEVERSLGYGGFGEVRLERNKEDGKARAVKRITTSSIMLSNSECEKELEALLEFSKPKYLISFFHTLRWTEAAVFVDFFGWFKDGSDVFLAMEYAPLGDLEKNIRERSGKISESEARDIAEQILLGLEIMHAESFAHRDLKPQNVLVVHGPPDWWVKLADFGLSKRLTDGTAFHTKAGTQSYMAPEILNYLNREELEEEYTNSVDIWAAGCIIYRLVAGTVPFPPGKSLIKYCEDGSLFPYDALLENGIKSECFKFLRQLLNSHPGHRPPATQALKHPWIVSGESSQTTKRTSLAMQREAQQELTEFSELTFSGNTYNTATHNGLRSYAFSSVSEPTISRSQPDLSGSSSTLKQTSQITSMSESTLRPLGNNKTRLRTPESFAHTSDKPLPPDPRYKNPDALTVTRRPLFQGGRELAIPPTSRTGKRSYQDPNFQSEAPTHSAPGRQQNGQVPEVTFPSEIKENKIKLIELMQEHLAKLQNNKYFVHRLNETLHDTTWLDTLANQVELGGNEKLLLKHLSSSDIQRIRRLVLDAEFLQRSLDKLQSGSNFDELPLGLVLTLLRTRIAQTSPAVSSISAGAQPEEKAVQTPTNVPASESLPITLPVLESPLSDPIPAPLIKEFQPFAARAIWDAPHKEDWFLQFEKDDLIFVAKIVDSMFWEGKLIDGEKTKQFQGDYVSKVIHVQAISPYLTPRPGEIGFVVGDIMRLLEPTTSKDWWKGELGDWVGLIPMNFVKVYDEENPPPPEHTGTKCAVM